MRATWQDPPEYREPASAPQFAWPRMTKVVRRLLIVNSVVFAIMFFVFLAERYEWIPEGYSSRGARLLGLTPSMWRASFPLVPAWQLLTYGLLHAADVPMHIIGNMLMLYFFGTMLEEMVGGRRFFLAYLSAQLVGALFFLVAGVLAQSAIPAIGASGAVYGVMIAVATMRPTQRVIFIIVPLTLRAMALIIVAITVVGALLSFQPDGGGDGVAHLVHLGGIVYGYLAVKTGLLFKDPVEALQHARALHEVERAEKDDERMDRLLEKIHREGMAALTKSEREFLKRVSSRR